MVAVFDSGPSHPHEAAVMSVLQRNLRGCGRCKIKTYPLYDSAGNMPRAKFLGALQAAETDGALLLHFSWNQASNSEFKPVLAELDRLQAAGKVIVAAAGESVTQGRRIQKLDQTVMGQVDGALIIGELTRGGWLNPRSNYGEELFTALKTPHNRNGSSFAAAMFTARLAKAMTRSTDTAEVLRVLKQNKSGFNGKWAPLKALFRNL